jgi:hypothetical protein
MDPITIIAIIPGLVLAIIFSLIEDAFEKMFNPIFRLIGLKSSTGPIDIIAKHNDPFIELTIINNGKGKTKLAALQGLGGNGKKEFPVPCSSESEAIEEVAEKKEQALRKHFLSEKIHPGSEKKVCLDSAKLDGHDLNILSVLDMEGIYRPITKS